MKKNIGVFVVWFCLVGIQNSFAYEFELSSPQLEEGGVMAHEQVYSGFGCTGKNISPELNWYMIPDGTKSFALTVYDPDAPTGSGWWHWVIFNIPVDTTKLVKNAGDVNAKLAPQGSVQSRTDYGKPGYGGACPPPGDKPHRYQFTLYALDVEKLDLDENATAALVGFFLHQHAIETSLLTVKYSR